MNPTEALEHLGLEKKEVALYLALLELGETTILELSKRAAIKRPTVYLLIQSLEEKGLVSRVLRGKKTLFSPQHPKKLITEAELRLAELKAAVPQLESIFERKEGKPRLVLFEGKDARDRAYDNCFRSGGEILFMGTLKGSSVVLPGAHKRGVVMTRSQNFSIREITADSPQNRTDAEKRVGPFHSVRFFPKDIMPFEADLGIYGYTVLITSAAKDYVTVVIESDTIANAFRAIFEMVWLSAKKLD